MATRRLRLRQRVATEGHPYRFRFLCRLCFVFLFLPGKFLRGASLHLARLTIKKIEAIALAEHVHLYVFTSAISFTATTETQRTQRLHREKSHLSRWHSRYRALA